MKGQLSISDWLASMAAVQEEKEPAEQQEKKPDRPSEARIRQGSIQGSTWKTVTYEEARKWARGKWEALKGVQESYRAQYINMYLVEGVEFRDEELKGKGA